MPFRMPGLSEEELLRLSSGTFHDGVAGALNLLFGVKVSAWDVSCAIGRYPVRLVNLGRKTLLCQLWHNPEGDFAWASSALADLFRQEQTAPEEGIWTHTAIRFAVLCGIFSQLRQEKQLTEAGSVDISLTAGDLSGLMAAWYAKKLGLPVGKIIVSCQEGGALWELVHQGQLRLDRLDQLPVGLERLIYECGGPGEVTRFLQALHQCGVYCPGEPVLWTLRRWLCVSVVSRERALDTAAGTLSRGCGLSARAALAYSGLQDHRVISGTSSPALVLEDKKPV